MPGLICHCCKSSTEDHKAVKCSICKKTFKYSCVELSTSEVRLINGKKGLTWTCGDCLEMGIDMQALQAAIVELKNEIAELKTKSSQHFVSAPVVDENQFEEILQEIQERESRKKNIMIYGVSEQQRPEHQNRANQDKETVTEILSALSVTFNQGNIKAIRLGKFDPSKSSPRPIKVTFNEVSIVHDTISKAKNLKGLVQYRKIGISLDRTPRQIKQYRTIKTQFDERIAAGETNLKIKYIRGVPKIISLN